MMFIAGFTILAGLALLPTYAQSYLAGFAFGSLKGSLAALAGFGGASMIGYVIARFATGDRVLRFIGEKAKWRAVQEELIGGGFFKTFGVVTLIRFPFNCPFALCNLVMGATRVPPVSYLLGTWVGMAPRTIVAVIIGAQVESWDSEKTGMPRWLIVAGLITAFVVILIMGKIVNRAIANLQTSEPASRLPDTSEAKSEA
jgi:uncharacterized membrane protein YdjX (TVP38/TMEM64 family)